MPYVATRILRECLPTGEVVTHEMGAVLTRFESWNYAIQKALLRREDVVKVGGDDGRGAGVAQAPSALPVAPCTVESARPDAEELACPHCPGKAFANRQGLRLHTTRMHKGGA